MTADAGITRLLQAAATGNCEARDALFDSVYQELRSIAKAQRRRWGGNATLSTTALSHEAYLRLARHDIGNYDNRKHFFLGRHLNGDYEGADTGYRRALAIYEAELGADARDTGEVRMHLATPLEHQERYQESPELPSGVPGIRRPAKPAQRQRISTRSGANRTTRRSTSSGAAESRDQDSKIDMPCRQFRVISIACRGSIPRTRV